MPSNAEYGAALAAMLERIGPAAAVPVQDEALSRAALAIADDVAIALGVAGEPEVEAYRAFAHARSRAEEATLFAPACGRADRFWAASVNALAMTTAEFDEGSRRTPCHAGLYTIPALLAEAEARGLTCGAVLRAEVLAYEATVRIADSWKAAAGAYPNHYTHAKSATIGAALARGLACGLDAAALFEAMGVAATLTAAGPRNHLLGGAMVRNAWPAAATLSGMMSVEWSGFGLRGLPTSVADVFQGVLGFEAVLEPLRRDLDGRWEILDGYHRVHASHLFCSALIECLLELRGKVATDQIESIAIEIHDDAVRLTDPAPATTLAARFSLPHVAAATLVLGHAGVEAFSTASLADPAIAALRGRVRVAPLAEGRFAGAKWPAAVRIVAGGQSVEAGRAEAMGGHGRQHSDETVFEKIAGLTGAHWPSFADLSRRLVALDPEILALPVGEFLARAAKAPAPA